MNNLISRSRKFRLFYVGILLANSMPLSAQTTVSLNLDYAEGKYGETEKSSAWTMPLIIKHQMGDFSLKLNLPYVRATGTAAAGGDRFAPSRQVQEGFGDMVVTATYAVLGGTEPGLMLDFGAKAKFATADKQNDLITTGKNDYSLLADFLQPIGPVVGLLTVGKTKKGDPDGVDYRDPWFASAGLSYKAAERTNVGVLYDFRQKLTPRGAPVSEAMLFVEHKFSNQYRLQAYVVRGFSDASPDLGVGATVSARF